MNFYTFTGDGVWLGAAVVVLACAPDAAMRIAKKWAAENCVDPESLELKTIEPLKLPSVVYGCNGNY